jgi:copper chaperone CopZ
MERNANEVSNSSQKLLGVIEVDGPASIKVSPQKSAVTVHIDCNNEFDENLIPRRT